MNETNTVGPVMTTNQRGGKTVFATRDEAVAAAALREVK